jgi:ABC-type branched-subunit amino acid transport system permease subunit
MNVDVLFRLLAIGLSNGAIIALNAIGVTLVYGAVRMINFAHGDLFALTTVIVSMVIIRLGLQLTLPAGLLFGGLVLALAAAMAFGGLLNVAVERAAFRPFRNGSRVAPLIATIGISFMLYQGALLLRYATNRYIPGEHRSVPGIDELPRVRTPELLPDLDLVHAFGLPLNVRYTLKDLLVVLVAGTLALVVGWLLQYTRTGRALRACAQDPELAELSGVDRTKAIRTIFALGGALAGAAAFVFTLYYTHPFTNYGVQSGIIAFTAAVLGGIGNPRGAFVSGLLLGVLAAFSDYFLAAQWTQVVLLSILLLLLIVRPSGFGGEERGMEVAATPAFEIVSGRLTPNASTTRRLLIGAAIATALLYPALDSTLRLGLQVVVSNLLIFALLALGLNIVLGFAGMLDLGYAACFAIGAYTAALLTTPGGVLSSVISGPADFLAVLAVSAAAAALLGAVSGALTLRLRGEYLAIATLALGQIVPQVYLNLDRWTGGARGMSALPPPRILTHSLQNASERYFLVLGLVLIVALACRRLANSRIGRAWAALSMDDTAAASCGVAPARARSLAFILSAAIAGIAGALFANVFSYVDPSQAEFRLSAMVLAMVVIGGAGSVPGAIIGALVVASYDQLLIPLLGAWAQRLGQTDGGAVFALLDLRSLNFLAFGLALYLTTLFRLRNRKA